MNPLYYPQTISKIGNLARNYPGILFVCMTLITLLSMGCSSNNAKSMNTPLVFGTDASYYPYEFRDEKGTIIGFDIDIAKLISKKLNRPFSIRLMDFNVLLEAVKKQTIDIAINNIAVTPLRAQEYAMIPYHRVDNQYYVLGFWNEIPKQMRSLDDAGKAGLNIGVQFRSQQADYLDTIPGLNVSHLVSAALILNDLRFNRIDAAFWDSETGMYIKIQHPEVKLIKIPIPKERWLNAVGLALNKHNSKLIKQVTKVIEELRQDGTLNKLEKKWLTDKKPDDFLEKG